MSFSKFSTKENDKMLAKSFYLWVSEDGNSLEWKFNSRAIVTKRFLSAILLVPKGVLVYIRTGF